jgi:hypothetical protein
MNNPTFNSYTLNYTISGSCVGSITNVTLLGGTPPYTLVWSGSSFTANTLNISSLCAGIYNGTVTDSLGDSSTTQVEVKSLTPVTLSATVINSSCTGSTAAYCTIKINSFTHTQPTVNYILYRDGTIVGSAQYVGSGNFTHTFSGLPPGAYTVTGYDGYNNTYQSVAFSGCQTHTTSTGAMSAGTIVENWDRVCPFNRWANYIHGPAATFPLGAFPSEAWYTDFQDVSGQWYTTDDPNFWLFTGNQDDRLTDTSLPWYQSEVLSSEQATYEGEDMGPAAIAKVIGNAGTFYYSKHIGRFVMLNWTAIGGNYQWTTINPTKDQSIGNPTAAEDLTSDLQWTVENLTTQQYTISGASNTVVLASDKAETTGAYGMVQCTSNSGIENGFISNCSHLNYVHEVTLGSTAVDNDTIGVYLCWFKDENGIYGDIGQSYNIALHIANGNGTSTPKLIVTYNNSNSVNTFRLFQEDAIWDSVFNSTILQNDGPYYSGSTGDAWFNLQGNVRFKITRSGELGENFKIECTDTMGNQSGTQTEATIDVGALNPYNAAYEINFSLNDPTTWTGSLSSAYEREGVIGNELVKFLGSQKYGYWTASQALTQFFDIDFEGQQSSYIVIPTTLGLSDSKYFELYDKDTINTDVTDPIVDDYSNSFGGYRPCRNKGVPVIAPTAKVLMQTNLDPLVTMSGATKISHVSKEYNIYYSEDITGINIGMNFIDNTVELRNNKAYAKYSVYPYSPESGEFEPTTLITKIFDNLTDIVPGAGGFGVKTTDNISLGSLPTQNYWEYCIKPSFIFKDKLEDVFYAGCRKIKKDGESDIWFDTLNINRTSEKQYGIYNPSSDYYFIVVSKPERTNIQTETVLYTTNDSCELYNQQTTAISGSSEPYNADSVVILSGKTWTAPLTYPNGGNMLVTVNGLTLFKASDSTMEDGDFITDGYTISIRKDTLEDGDLINMFYVPNSTGRSNYVQQLTVGSAITSTQVASGLYYHNINYRISLDYPPLGSVGMVWNGTVLYSGRDFKLINSRTIEITSITYPTGLDEGDKISLFYFTKLTVSGVASVKSPEVNVQQITNVRNNETVELLVFDMSATTVYTETKRLKRGLSGPKDLTFTMDLPGPGDYTYQVVSTREYPLISGDMVRTQNQTEKVPFIMKPEVYYYTPESTNV